MRSKLIPYSLVFILFFLGCTHPTSITVASNIPESIFLVNMYNTNNINKQIYFLTIDNPYDQLEKFPLSTDVIISDILPTEDQINLFSKKIISYSFLKKKNPFRTSILAAFSIPLIVTKKTSSQDTLPLPSPRISLNELSTLISQSLNASKKPPLWIPFFTASKKSIYDVFISEDKYKKWISNTIPNWNVFDHVLNTNYKNTPIRAILLSDDIAYTYIPSHILFSQPQDVIKDLTIALLTNNDGTIAMVDPVFISIPKINTTPALARKFIQWMQNKKSHAKLLSSKESFNEYSATRTFLGRSFSIFSDLSAEYLLPYNKWLFQYSPAYSDIMYRNKSVF